ncbi:hypothetical protein ATB53_01325 [Xanthomonas translucens]|uniref:Uncharacterized protein n=1 Tax=Xanthomonas campestris pv. translucens TaxID=343 RepID=A0A109HH34_XANCT|nr:hypothetical protein ATB53_01325 [Xanthomonas translucens]
MLPGHFLLLEFFPLLGGHQVATPLLIGLHLRRLLDLCGYTRNSDIIIGEQRSSQSIEVGVACAESLPPLLPFFLCVVEAAVERA